MGPGCGIITKHKFFGQATRLDPELEPIWLEEASVTPAEPLPSFALETVERVRQLGVQTEPSNPAGDAAPLPPPRDDSTGESGTVEDLGYAPQVVELTLEQARAAALEGNLDLAVVSFDPTIATEQILEEIWRFESTFDGTVNRMRSDPPPPAGPLGISPFGTQPERATDSFNPSINVPLTTGGLLSFRQQGTRLSAPGLDAIPSIHSLAPTLSLSQPLLRGGGTYVNTAGIRFARLQQGRVDAATKLTAIRVLAETEQAYWVLFGAQKNLEVATQQVNIAQQQLTSAKRLVEAGTISNVDVLRSESGLLARNQVVISADLEVLLRTRELKRIIQSPGLQVDSTAAISVDSRPNLVGLTFDRAALTAKAMENRLELVDLAVQYEQDQVNVNVTRNQILPQVDFVFEGKLLGADPKPLIASRQAWGGEFHDWFAGLSFSLPLAANQSARASHRRAVLSQAQTVAQQAQLEVAIMKQIDDAVDRFEQNWKRILAAEKSVAAAQRAFEAETRLFQLGQRTSDLVLFAADSLASNQLQLFQAVVDFQLSRIEIAISTGTVLGYSQVELTDESQSLDTAEGLGGGHEWH